MPAAHPPVEVVPGDIYLHDLFLQDDDGTPIDITFDVFSVTITDGWKGAAIAGITPTAVVVDGPTGHVRVTVLAAETPTLFTSSQQPIVRLRNDTLQTTLLVWELKEDQ